MRLIFLCELHWNSFKLECVNIGLNNDKHIYAKNGTDNRHIYVWEIAN